MIKTIKVKKTKKGFTLLETLLSVAILVIVSTMLMNGFMSAINFSHNTSVYASSAGGNYSSVMSDLSYYAVNSEKSPITAFSSLETNGTVNALLLKGTSHAGNSIVLGGGNKLHVKVFDKTLNATGRITNIVGGFSGEDYVSGSGEDETNSDNRYGYSYIPAVNKVGSGSHVGEIRIFRKVSSDEGKGYFWGWKDPETNAVNIVSWITEQ